MRVLLCVNRDFMGNLALNYLWPALQDHAFDIVLSDGVGKNAVKAAEISEWGRVENAMIEDGLFPILDRRDRAEHEFKSFSQLACGSQSGALRRFDSINRDEGLTYVQRYQPDIVVSIRFGQILKMPVIAIPRHGVINLHSGVLPGYRGILATFWAMLHNDERVGCTLHTIHDETIDTGSVIGIHTLPTDRTRSVLWNVASIYQGGAAMVASALSKLVDEQSIGVRSSADDEGTYFSYPRQEDVDRFLRAGGQLHTKRDYRDLLLKYVSGEDTDRVLERYPDPIRA